MSGKNLTFKIIMDGDSKGLVAAAKQSESVSKKLFETIKVEAEQLKQTSAETAKALGNIVPEKSKELADGLTKSLTGATQIIRDAGDNAKSTAKNFTDFGNQSVKALAFLKSDLEKAKKKLEDFSKTKATPADIEIAQKQVDKLEKEVQQAENAFIDFHTEVGRANASLEKTDTAAQAAQKGINNAKFAVTALVGAMATLGIGLGGKELANTADSYTNLSARINIATKDGGDFKSAMAGVHQVALMTNSSLDATGGLFTRLNAVGKDMGMTQQNSLDLTKTINQAIQISGTSAQASEAFTQKFLQSMQQGTLRGEEFGSMMENGYGVAEALAKGLGVTTGELKKMADNGELGAERVYKALLSQKDAVQQTFDQYPTTIGNALTKISTSWEILIGRMDQSNGASATVADWLVTIADNMSIVETLLSDIGEGFIWVGDQLKKIDPATIEALKTALSSVYETLKNAVATFGNGFQATIGQLDLILGSVFNFNSGVDEASDKTNGFTKLLQALNVALGFVSDGFSAIAIVANLLTGLFYDVASAWLNFKSKFTWGDTKQQIISEMNEMGAKAQEWYDKASNGAMNFQSKGIVAIEEISKTQEQKNAESLADSKATFSELVKQNEDLAQKSRDLAQERVVLDARLNQARMDGNASTIDAIIQKSNELEDREKEHAVNKAKLNNESLLSVQSYAEAAIRANNGVMDGVMQADLLTKGYIVTIDEAGKVSVLAGENAAQSAENAKVKEEALKVAKENVKKADEEYLAYQKQATAERALLEQQIETAKRTGDLNALASAQTSLAGINTKEAELANNRNMRTDELNQLNSGAGQVAENAIVRARKAAVALGLDLDVSLNKVSSKFQEGSVNVDTFVAGLAGLGVTGQQAGEVTYQAWQKWVAEAKSQAELDAAKAKLQSFGDQGKLSTAQVEMGLQAIKRASQELPEALSPAEAAMERLGIKSKEQLKLAAENALTDLETVMKSGEATQEGLQKAYEETVRLAQASGNAQVMAAANAKAAYLGLEVQLDATGKATVTKLGEIQQAAQATQRSVSQVSRAESASEPTSSKPNDSLAGQDYWEEFKAKRAKLNEATQARMNSSKAGASSRPVGLSAMSDSAPITPQADIANMVPMIASNFDIQGIETMQPTEKKVLEIQSGSKSAELEGTPEAVNSMEDILREFEMLKRGM